MARFFLPSDSWGEVAWLTGDEAKHLSQVLRIRAGEKVAVFDGKGRRADATVEEVSRERVRLELGAVTSIPILEPEVILALAIPKGKKMDLVVQKAVELGVSAIQPLVTRNTIVQPGEGKSDKWQRVALEACKQSGLDHLPTVHEPLDFGKWIEALGRPVGQELRLIASLAEGARPMREILRRADVPSRVVLLVGPEGDFTPAETQAALDAVFAPVTLGATVLRAETASLFCLSAIRYEFEN
ncbi:MAG: 16S rRNA (uracil(1498)-N(3))-methyltransferase [Verrucomicrobiales bacterium VVV1]|nr:MAG: 16S rRNA (uracil(1498)-N(3))-methyltransferase [Verrucomicrobiales bacterium VVV1]